MKKVIVLFLSLSCLLAVIGLGAPLNQVIEITDAAKSWVAHNGRVLYYTSSSSQYQLDNQQVTRMSAYSPQAKISLSPNSEYRLFSILQGLETVKDGKRYSDYFVLDEHNDLLYTTNLGTSSDLKPPVAAISDAGILALADPVNAHIYVYAEGNLMSEGQLYEHDGDLSLERNIRMRWVDDELFILLERPGFNGGPAGNSLFIRINSNGRGQITRYLPFTYLQKFVAQNHRLFISGYNYNPADKQMMPNIVEVNRDGTVLWNNENYGHELVLSQNGDYLAALTSHENVQRFDLRNKRVEQIDFPHENKLSLGLSVNNSGELALIRVAVDFFAKRNTHFSQIYFPISGTRVDVQIDPRYPKLFQIHTDGDRFYIGTNYEWLDIQK